MRERKRCWRGEGGRCARVGEGVAGDNEWQSTVVLDPVFRPSRPPVQRWRSIDDMRETRPQSLTNATISHISTIINQYVAQRWFYDKPDIGALTHLAPAVRFLYVNQRIFPSSRSH